MIAYDTSLYVSNFIVSQSAIENFELQLISPRYYLCTKFQHGSYTSQNRESTETYPTRIALSTNIFLKVTVTFQKLTNLYCQPCSFTVWKYN